MKFNLFEILVLSLAVLSLIFSVIMWFVNANDLTAIYIGLWVPSILGFGCFIKLKVLGEKK